MAAATSASSSDAHVTDINNNEDTTNVPPPQPPLPTLENTNNSNPTSSNNRERISSIDSGGAISIEIPPPPLLQRSPENHILCNNTNNIITSSTASEESEALLLAFSTPQLQPTLTTAAVDAAESRWPSDENCFASPSGGNNNGGGGGAELINVDNIFNAMLDDTPANNIINNNNNHHHFHSNSNSIASGGGGGGGGAMNNSIFHNFTSSDNNNDVINNTSTPLSILIAPKKSNHNNVIGAYNPSVTSQLEVSQQPVTLSLEQEQSHLVQQQQPLQQHLHKRSGSYGTTTTTNKLSKSMGTTGYLLKHHRINNSHHHNITTMRNHSHNNNNGRLNRVRARSREYNITMDDHHHDQHGIDDENNNRWFMNIRHAGYLLKRSNLPYVTSAAPVVAAGGAVDNIGAGNTAAVGASSGGDIIEPEPLFTLPFGGLSSSTDENSVVDTTTMGTTAGQDEEVVVVTQQQHVPDTIVTSRVEKGASIENAVATTTTTTAVHDNKENDFKEEEDIMEDDQQCFCAPLVHFLLGKQRKKRIFHEDTTTTISKQKDSFGSPIIDDSERQQQQQQQKPILLHQEYVVSHQIIPLKGPARSDPVPISPRRGNTNNDDDGRVVEHDNDKEHEKIERGQQQQQQQQQHNSRIDRSGTGGILRSYSNEEKSSKSSLKLPLTSTTSTITTTGTGTGATSLQVQQVLPPNTTTTKKREYPPPPPDYIDPRDGHIWRAKYCVLEEGILYFYRNAMEGESDEAQAERNESRSSFHASSSSVAATTNNTTIRHQSLSSSPSIPIPIDSTGGSTATTVTGTTTATNTSLSRIGKKDLFDLSKSPMPLKKSDYFDLRLSSPSVQRPTGAGTAVGNAISVTTNTANSTTTTNDATNTTPSSSSLGRSPILHHSNSTSTFHHDMDILWEKRVALDCVGAVRSSVQEHGDHAFELIAYGVATDDDDEQSDASSSIRNSAGGGEQRQQQHEIIDRLILRAGSSDDMNTWMFQFHRSLSSYMQRIVNSALNNRHHGTNVFRTRPDSPVHQLAQHRRIGTPVGNNSINKQKQPSSSPMGSSYGSNFSPIIGPSLSHGHGRNAIYRRQVRDLAGDLTPGGSPVDIHSKPSLIPRIDRSESIDSQQNKAVGVLALREIRKSVDGTSSTSSSPATKPVSISAAPKKYIPPHMRRRMEANKNVGESSGDAIVSCEIVQNSLEKHVALNDSIDRYDKDKTTQAQEDDGAESETPSDSALSTTSSLLSRQLEDSNNMSPSNHRLGGCADPTVSVGSILDDVFIPRKASVLGNARLEPYGGVGGGFYTSTRCVIQSEEGEIPFGDDSSNTVEVNRSFLSGLKWEVGASSECGVRNSNEDAYVVINNLDEMISSQGLTSFADQDVGQTKQQGLFAIFDGHVGNQAARFSAEKFPEMLMEEQSVLASRDSASLSSIQSRTLEVLSKAFDRLDREFCSLCTKDGRDWDCGSTALAALIVDDVVTLANLGDCRGVVCRVVTSGFADTADTESEWQELDPEDEEENLLWDRANGGDAFSSNTRLLWREVTEAHSPLLSEERDRIENANGWIIHETEIPTGQLHRMDFFDEDVVEIVKRCFADRLGQHRSDPARRIQIARTCGDLAVSRAIGDRDFKAAYNLPSLAMSWEGPPVFLYPDGHSRRFKGDLVSSAPDVKFFKVGQDGVIDEFLLMACDGLWDVMDGDDAVRIAKDLLFDKKLSAKDGAERLAELAKHLGSSDNITVILIRFYWENIDTK